MFQNNINLFGVLIPVVIHIWLHTAVPISFGYLRNHIIFKNCSVHGSAFQCIRTAPLCQVTYQSCIVKIQLRCFYQSLQQIIGIRMKIENDSQCFQNAQPVFCLCLVNVRILRYIRHIYHLSASCCCRCHELQKLKRINRIGQIPNIPFYISR